MEVHPKKSHSISLGHEAVDQEHKILIRILLRLQKSHVAHTCLKFSGVTSKRVMKTRVREKY